ncbi:efflux transporter periplasmic adaptor subunit [Alcanivorax sp. HI0033]|uniref:efflux RND transporter periplasmic adaptor subunit n=1 Tax=unclassified Alcanivorax TaxID=2638842 RepID=UPI0007B8465D|nr:MULTISPECIES: efflux RND transporter periplasmic adaptor subunit [unclassified Alcanivorax]KZX78474.1 efflux transporter periplasmic adaptor subunit [Alcanivorax sp. HI0011]KZX79573.1 efflux transporter periplasmic adaptor subunit [Alcanivorax sp. HI0013]KZY20976.1 efflux transporter periplasmic adaptor subunit [Alcanivorax sp. HI0035]KZX71468.1 efflux transporter periplasmic adaptor subunit [Alcanivorax sp. HI0003]KZX72470.1 efflux transporter periplasmic adaptor subunit [Alcanivorax sp. H
MKTKTRFKQSPLALALLVTLASAAWAEENHAHTHNESNETQQHGRQPAPDGNGDHDSHGHGDAAEDAHEDEAGLELTADQQAMLNLQVITLQPQTNATQTLTVPAEITSNQYRTWVVPVRIDSQVQSRSATLGQHLKKGEPIATLFSPAMAQLQSDLQVAADAWRRVNNLGRRTVGNQRYLDAQGQYQSLRARAKGYGLDDDAIAAIEAGKSEKGVYTLTAPDDGLVLEDAFQQGQWLTAGSSLVTLVDESELWAEAALPPSPGLQIATGTPATVIIGDTEVAGKVIQSGHRLNPVTRTLAVRVAIPNAGHLLHPGMFADVALSLSAPENALTVPEEALTRGPDGDWQLFVEAEPGHYKPVEIQLNGQLENRRIVTGIKPGTRVVTRGAFFLASEMAKSGFDVHNH